MGMKVTIRAVAPWACLGAMAAIAIGGAIWSFGNDLWVLSILITLAVEFVLGCVYLLVSGRAPESWYFSGTRNLNLTGLHAGNCNELPADPGAPAPVNIDGTPMMGGHIDIKGNPYGVIDDHS